MSPTGEDSVARDWGVGVGLTSLSAVEAGRLACQLLLFICLAPSCHRHAKWERWSLFRWADFPRFPSENFSQERTDIPKVNIGLC